MKWVRRNSSKYRLWQEKFRFIIPILHLSVLYFLWPILVTLTLLHVIQILIGLYYQDKTKRYRHTNPLQLFVISIMWKNDSLISFSKWVEKKLIHSKPKSENGDLHVDRLTKAIWEDYRVWVTKQLNQWVLWNRSRKHFLWLIWLLNCLVYLLRDYPDKLALFFIKNKKMLLLWVLIFYVIASLDRFGLRNPVLVLLSLLVCYRFYKLTYRIKDIQPFTTSWAYETFPLDEVNWLKYATYESDMERGWAFGPFPANLAALPGLYIMSLDGEWKVLNRGSISNSIITKTSINSTVIEYRSDVLLFASFWRNYFIFLKLLDPNRNNSC